jgi:adenosine deaminase
VEIETSFLLEQNHMIKLKEYALRMPKVELHVHLEGSIKPDTLWLLAERNKIDLPYKTVESLHELYGFRDFPQFINNYLMITGCLKTADDYRLISYEFGRECQRQNIHYAEVTFSIYTNVQMTGMRWQTILEALNHGRAQALVDFGVRWQWVFDIVRNVPESQQIVTQIALDARSMGVVALGLGGSEAEFPAELFTTSFNLARDAGLRRVPHAGELAGPASIWAALNSLHADRIGHGVHCIEDTNLIEFLIEQQIPLELCPTSNIILGIYPGYAQHPLRKLWDAGVFITVNSDDPPMFNTSLNQEYQVLVNHFDFGYAELEKVSLNALNASFLSQNEKEYLTREFALEFNQLKNS